MNALNQDTEESKAKDFMQNLDRKNRENFNKAVLAEWKYQSNLTDANLQYMLAVTIQMGEEEKQNWQKVRKFNWKYFSDYDLRRQFYKYSNLGSSVLSEEKLKKLSALISDMQEIYSTAKICAFDDPKNCNLTLEPELTNIFANSRNPDELTHAWINWRKAVGPRCKNLFKEYVELSNEAARLNNFKDAGEEWLENYEDSQIKQQFKALWQQVKPLYLQIHAYVRFHLRKKYGDIVSKDGPIPAHLLGNMWAQSWGNILEFTLPYPNKKEEDLTKELEKQNYHVTKIFRTAEDFFKSIGLSAMPDTFWESSIFKKPKDREMICHPSAWDFYDGKTFRIKLCAEVTFQDFVTIHHEMGHTEYQLQYKDLPIIYRQGANNGFHEAIGDLISLSVQSRKHLRKLGLLKSNKNDSEEVLNSLFMIGLDKIVYLPFAYLLDLWRWEVFAGKVTPNNYNHKWWKLREKYQGIAPPVSRSEADFDPAAKYHTIGSVPYIRYFVSVIIQFQFHQALCKLAGEYVPNDPSKPLHKCDIYQNTDAGNALKKMLQMGSSRPWPDAMEALTGQRSMDASSLLEYFKPLQKWLKAENKKNGVLIGWRNLKKPRAASGGKIARFNYLHLSLGLLVLMWYVFNTV